MKINYKESGDLARLKWALKDGATPFSRIYSSMRQLRSSMSAREIELMIVEMLQLGQLVKQPHPLHQNEFFYKLPPGGAESD